jgi:hypothetical protein
MKQTDVKITSVYTDACVPRKFIGFRVVIYISESTVDVMFLWVKAKRSLANLLFLSMVNIFFAIALLV